MNPDTRPKYLAKRDMKLPELHFLHPEMYFELVHLGLELPVNGMKIIHLGMEHFHIGMKQVHLGMEHFHLGMKLP